MGAQTPNTVTLTLADLDRQMSMPGGYWHTKLGDVQFRIRKGLNKVLLVSLDDENGEGKFRILRHDRSVLKNSRQGTAFVNRNDLEHQCGGGIIIEPL